MKRRPTFAPYIGSIGPVARDEDLIPQLATELGRLLLRCRVDRETRKAHIKLVRDVQFLDAGADFNEAFLLDDLVKALSHYAPPYTYFGERTDDYGFWPEIDDAVADGDLPRLAYSSDSPYARAHWGEDVLLVDQLGHNVECGRFDKRGRFHSYWSAV